MENPALMFKSGGSYRTMSYGEFGDICFRVASGLMKRGIEPGERIAIFSQNRPEWAEADTGALLAGAINSAIYASSLPEEAAFIIQNLEATFLFVEDNFQLEKILAIREKISSVKSVFVFTEPFSRSNPSWVFPFSELLQEEASPALVAKIHELAEHITGEDTMCIIYTSGTTGNPKGVVLTHNNYIRTIEMLVQHVRDISKLKRNISFLPLAHAFERFAGYYLVLSIGSCIAYAESLETLMQNFREVKPNLFVAVPRVFEKMHARITQGVRSASPVKKAIFYWALGIGKKAGRYKMLGQPLPWHLKISYRLADALLFKKVKGAFGGQLEFCCSGGAPLSKEVAEFFDAMDILILEGWGATEATTPSTFNSPYDYRFGTVGRPLPGVEVRVAPDGELEVKGPNVFKEYWRNPEATKEKFIGDWSLTGDLAKKDEDGYLWFVGRKDDLITSSGYRIGPAEIEDCLIKHPAVAMAAVIGSPDEVRGEVVKAFIILKEGTPATKELAAEIQEFVKTRLAAHEYPREIEFVDQLPMTATGKIKRGDLRKLEIERKKGRR